MMSSMHGSLGEDLGDEDQLVSRVHDELLALRSGSGRLTVQKFGESETLRRVCGGGDLLDAYLMFEREMRRFQTMGRNEAAAALSITTPLDTVLDRLQETATQLSKDQERDQRSARRWSDRGMRTIARELVHLAQLQGRLGSEILGIEVHGSVERGLMVIIDQMTTTGLSDRAPLVRLWLYPESEDTPVEREIEVDMEAYPSSSVTRADYTMKRHRVMVELPEPPDQQSEAKLLTISVEGRDAPMRTVTIEDLSDLPEPFAVRFAVYRTIASIDLISFPGKL